MRSDGTCLECDRDDPVNPSHYKGDLVMRIIETFDLGFELGNVVKYILRHKQKAGLEDLLKSKWYLERKIAQMRGEAPPSLK